MQIKATVRYYSIPIRIPKIKIQTIASTDKDVDGATFSHTLLAECKMAWLLWKAAWWFLITSNIHLSYNLAMSLLIFTLEK